MKSLPPAFTAAVLERCCSTLSSHSALHGIAHWERVAQNAREIASRMGMDIPARLTDLFALFHDCQRLTDGADLLHGPRASLFLLCVYGESATSKELRWLRDAITFEEIVLVSQACAFHTSADPSTSPEEYTPRLRVLSLPARYKPGVTLDRIDFIRLCCDADRLDITRVGVYLQERYLFFPASRELAKSRGLL